ncbi:MAG: histidinol-phosphate transaminase [Terriglobales bacterium]
MPIDRPRSADPGEELIRDRHRRAAAITIAFANDSDRAELYAARHEVYAVELGQHPPNPTGSLSDSLDNFNVYIKATVADRIVGFVSVTPPGRKYSVDKYIAREDFPFSFDATLYEVRLLTVLPSHRRGVVASLLMYAALRWIETQGGSQIVAIGRQEILSLYRKAGLRSLGRIVKSGAVTYELLTATVSEIRERAEHLQHSLRWLESRAQWRLDIPFQHKPACSHGGAFFDAIGNDFRHLERIREVISADVLDAWFPPSPLVISAVGEHLAFLLRTSPPTDCAGLIEAIARARNIPADCVVPAAGSSELIFLAFREWLTHKSRVLILDPSYGEYFHVTERIVGCRVDRLPLRRDELYALSLTSLEAQLSTEAYDLAVIVNPNSPTGRHVARRKLERVLARIPIRTRIWIDETYVEYAGLGESLEDIAAQSQNMVVCKSMSKVYALSGARAAYLCAPPTIARSLRRVTPPWAVSLPAQVAAIKALDDPDYYGFRYKETHQMREALAISLRALGFEVCPGMANFLLCHLPAGAPSATVVSQRSRAHGLYFRTGRDISQSLAEDVLRIAVKDSATNVRIAEILEQVMRGNPSQPKPYSAA